MGSIRVNEKLELARLSDPSTLLEDTYYTSSLSESFDHINASVLPIDFDLETRNLKFELKTDIEKIKKIILLNSKIAKLTCLQTCLAVSSVFLLLNNLFSDELIQKSVFHLVTPFMSVAIVVNLIAAKGKFDKIKELKISEYSLFPATRRMMRNMSNPQEVSNTLRLTLAKVTRFLRKADLIRTQIDNFNSLWEVH